MHTNIKLDSAYVTGSVMSYMEREGKPVVDAYLKDCKSRGVLPNYSEMLRVAELDGGTTRDHIRFESRKVVRSIVTAYLRGTYKRRYKDG